METCPCYKMNSLVYKIILNFKLLLPFPVTSTFENSKRILLKVNSVSTKLTPVQIARKYIYKIQQQML